MPSSPISRNIKVDDFPEDWKSLNKMFIPDSKTAHYYSVDFNPKNSTVHLMCCYIEDDPSVNDHWYHVEDMEEVHRTVLNTIRDLTGISFHDSIWVQMTATEV